MVTAGARAREVVVGALLTALALLIPLAFRGWLQVVIGPFTATLASHVPSMLAMFVGPLPAALVGLGSTIGFWVTLGPVVAARAFTHVLFGVAGAYLYRAGWPAWAVLLAVLPIHAGGEGLAVRAFGVPAAAAAGVAAGSALHHVLDSLIALALVRLLMRAGVAGALGLGAARAQRAGA